MTFLLKRSLPHGILIYGTGLMMALITTGCSDKAVYNPSIAGLNQKAQAMMQAGQVDDAISRLEAARDLNPDEPNTIYNLAVAYQTKGQYDKAISLLEPLAANPAGIQAGDVHRVLGQVFEAKGDTVKPAKPEASNQSPERAVWYTKALKEYRLLEPKTPEVSAHIEQLQRAVQQ